MCKIYFTDNPGEIAEPNIFLENDLVPESQPAFTHSTLSSPEGSSSFPQALQLS